MTVITSKHTGPLGLPRGPVIPAGKSVRVDNWHVLKNHAVVRAWLDAGVIEAEAGDVEAQPSPAIAVTVNVSAHDPDAEPEDLASLRGEYKELFGKQPFMGWDAETLRSKIDAKLAE